MLRAFAHVAPSANAAVIRMLFISTSVARRRCLYPVHPGQGDDVSMGGARREVSAHDPPRALTASLTPIHKVRSNRMIRNGVAIIRRWREKQSFRRRTKGWVFRARRFATADGRRGGECRRRAGNAAKRHSTQAAFRLGARDNCAALTSDIGKKVERTRPRGR